MMYNYPLFSEEYLSHEGRGHNENPPGRGSGRYPWGSGKNPRQNTAKEMRKAKRTKRQADRILAKRQKKEKEAEEAARKTEATKQAAIRSGDADQVQKYAHLMSNNELEEAISRINKQQRLDDLTPTQKDKIVEAEEKVTEVMRHVATVTSWINTATDAANAVSKLQKSIEPYTKKGKELDKLYKSGNNSEILRRQNELSEEQLKKASLRKQYTDILTKKSDNSGNEENKTDNSGNEKKETGDEGNAPKPSTKTEKYVQPEEQQAKGQPAQAKKNSDISNHQIKSDALGSTKSKKTGQSAAEAAISTAKKQAEERKKYVKAVLDNQDAADTLSRASEDLYRARKEYRVIREKKANGEDYDESALQPARNKVEEANARVVDAGVAKVQAETVIHPEMYDTKLAAQQYRENYGAIGYYQKIGGDAIDSVFKKLYGSRGR